MKMKSRLLKNAAKNLWSVLILSICLLGCSHRNGVKSDGQLSSKRWRPEFKVHKDVFKNGLTVLFVEDHSAPVVSYTTWFKVGSAWEKLGATGIAHLFEHMMFKGTPRFNAQQFFRELESKGAMVNAFTQRDATVYYEVIASKYLETVIDMESDRLAHLTLSQADLDSERQVVKEERRLRIDSNFQAQQMEVLQKLAFDNHPYGRPTIGYQDDLDRLSLEQCREFFSNYYQPGNAVVTIAGDFDYDLAKTWIEKYYGPIQGHPVPELRLADEQPPLKEKRKEIFRPVESDSLMIGYYIPSMYSEDAEKLSLLSWALFGMTSSRANLKLVREKQLVLGVAADAELERFPYLFIITAEPKKGVSSRKVEEEIYKLIDDIKTNLLSKEELERVKNGLVYTTINEGKSPAGIASWLAGGEFYWSDHMRIFERLDKFYSITPNELQKIALKYFNPENRVVVNMRPLSARVQRAHLEMRKR